MKTDIVVRCGNTSTVYNVIKINSVIWLEKTDDFEWNYRVDKSYSYCHTLLQSQTLTIWK